MKVANERRTIVTMVTVILNVGVGASASNLKCLSGVHLLYLIALWEWFRIFSCLPPHSILNGLALTTAKLY